MADPSQAASAAPRAPGALPPTFKYRIRFAKAGLLRLVSHHDLLNCFERLLRRAAVPLATSRGFHPKPKIVFALSLALGIVGRNEVVELELTEELAASELLQRLRAQAPPGIEFHSARLLTGKSTAQPRRAFYRLSLTEAPADLEQRIDALLSAPSAWIERHRPHLRRLDLRPFVSQLQPVGQALEMALWITPYGSARPEEVAQLLGLDESVTQGAYFERTDLEMMDEVAGDALHFVPCPVKTSKDESDSASRKESERPTPLLTGPLAFDS